MVPCSTVTQTSTIHAKSRSHPNPNPVGLGDSCCIIGATAQVESSVSLAYNAADHRLSKLSIASCALASYTAARSCASAGAATGAAGGPTNRPCSEPSSNGDCARYRSTWQGGVGGSSDDVDAVLESEQVAEVRDEVSEEGGDSVEDGVHTTRPASLCRGELGLVVSLGQVYPGWKRVKGSGIPRRAIRRWLIVRG